MAVANLREFRKRAEQLVKADFRACSERHPVDEQSAVTTPRESA